MRSRLGMAAQALGVAALGAIVYFAFLSPNDSGPLTGIDVEPPLEQPPPERHANKRKKPEPKPDRPRPVKAARVPRSTPVVPSVEVEPVADTPAGAQYAGTVARILGEVSRSQD